MNYRDLDIIAFGYCISKYLLTIPKEEAIRRLSAGYSKEALLSLYHTAMLQEDYEVCGIVEEVINSLGHDPMILLRD
jgi:hypothetical protein